MTYQEKYEELFKKYDKSIKDLHHATQEISSTNGFGNPGDISNYFKAHTAHRFAEREFQQLLNYVTTKNLNPNSEYLESEYMYNFIKEDQRRRGIPWNDDELAPSVKGGLSAYECVISLTNDGEITGTTQATVYKFPVINLHHGKECYNYLSNRLQNRDGEVVDVSNSEFPGIDETHQVYVKVALTTWR